MAAYDTPEKVARLSNMDAELAEILKASPLPEPDYSPSSLESLRQNQASQDQKAYNGLPTLGVQEEVMTIAMRDGHQSEIRVYRASDQPGPLVVLVFGGGFVIGTNVQMTLYSRPVAALYGATVVNITYRRAPEHKFPTAPNDVWDNIEWLTKNSASIGADLSKGFVIGGASAGANLSVVTAQKTLRHKMPYPITGVWACIPLCMEEELVPEQHKHLWFSRNQNADAPLLNAQALKMVMQMYEPDVKSEDFSPFNSSVHFSQNPPTFVQVAGLDPLRDDGLVYEKVLRDNGVATRLNVYPGVPHGHYAAFIQIEQGQKSNQDTVHGLGWLLGKAADSEAVKKLFVLDTSST